MESGREQDQVDVIHYKIDGGDTVYEITYQEIKSAMGKALDSTYINWLAPNARNKYKNQLSTLESEVIKALSGNDTQTALNKFADFIREAEKKRYFISPSDRDSSSIQRMMNSNNNVGNFIRMFGSSSAQPVKGSDNKSSYNLFTFLRNLFFTSKAPATNKSNNVNPSFSVVPNSHMSGNSVPNDLQTTDNPLEKGDSHRADSVSFINDSLKKDMMIASVGVSQKISSTSFNDVDEENELKVSPPANNIAKKKKSNNTATGKFPVGTCSHNGGVRKIKDTKSEHKWLNINTARRDGKESTGSDPTFRSWDGPK